MKITLQGFSGAVPKVEPRYLPDQIAVVAETVNLQSGGLYPMRGRVLSETGPTSGGGSWFSFYKPSNGAPTLWFASANVDVVQAPIVAGRYYITGASARPQVRDGANIYDVALAAPTVAPTLVISGTSDPNNVESTLYAYTWVTSLDEESPPSPLSAPDNMSPGQIATVTTPGAAPAGRVNRKRIYRSKTSFSGATELFFVAEIPLATTSYAHDLTTAPFAEAIPSKDYDPPPDGMIGITEMPNGIFAAFIGREVCFSEPYIPHAWPVKYRLAITEDIVGLVSLGTSLAVLTKGNPVIMQGLHPDSMASARLETTFACLSKRGIVDFGYAAIYPSAEGLVEISANGARLLTEDLFRREQWQAFTPSNIIAIQYRKGYLFWSPKGGDRLTHIDFDNGKLSAVEWPGFSYRDIQFDAASGKLYGLEGPRSIYSVDDQAVDPIHYRWKSKPFRLPSPMPLGVVYVDAEPDPTMGAAVPAFSCKVYANGALVRDVTTPNSVQRLPPPPTPSDVWQVEISGNYRVTRVVVCSTPDEVFQ